MRHLDGGIWVSGLGLIGSRFTTVRGLGFRVTRQHEDRKTVLRREPLCFSDMC